MTIFESQRVFQLWKYHVSHRQLLLVSDPMEEFVTRVELLFYGVQMIKLKTRLISLTVSEADTEQSQKVRMDSGFAQSAIEGKIFTVSSDGFSGYVIAFGFRLSEDDGNYKNPSKIYFDPKDLFGFH